MSGFNRTQQYGQAPLGRFVIDLRKSRVNGESFPAIQGSFFYVEAVDLPCRISFNNSDDTQSLGISSGFQLNMPFSGITLFHDDYATAGAANQNYQLVVYSSRDPRAFNQYVNPVTQSQLPSSPVGLIGNTVDSFFPIFPRSRFLTIQGIMQANAGGDPGPIISSISFLDVSGNVITGPSGFVKNNVTYSQIGSYSTEYVASLLLVAGSWGYRIAKNNVPVPSNADRARLRLSFFLAPASVSESYFANIS
jgi:hypothetical protein